MKFWVKINSQDKRVEIDERDGLYLVAMDGTERVVDCQHAGHKDYLSIIIDNRSYLVECAPVKLEEGKYYATIEGRRYDLEVLDERLFATREATKIAEKTGPYIIASPMPGLIVDVRVKVGDRVRAGSAVIVMEAMKMQNELLTEVDGVVKAIRIRADETVDSQVPLIEIERS